MKYLNLLLISLLLTNCGFFESSPKKKKDKHKVTQKQKIETEQKNEENTESDSPREKESADDYKEESADENSKDDIDTSDEPEENSPADKNDTSKENKPDPNVFPAPLPPDILDVGYEQLMIEPVNTEVNPNQELMDRLTEGGNKYRANIPGYYVSFPKSFVEGEMSDIAFEFGPQFWGKRIQKYVGVKVKYFGDKPLVAIEKNPKRGNPYLYFLKMDPASSVREVKFVLKAVSEKTQKIEFKYTLTIKQFP